MVDWEKGNSLQLLPSSVESVFSTLWIWAVFHLTLVGTMLQKGCSPCSEQSFNNLWVHPLLLLEPCELHLSKSVTDSWRIWDHVERCPTYSSWGNSQLTTDPWASSPWVILNQMTLGHLRSIRSAQTKKIQPNLVTLPAQGFMSWISGCFLKLLNLEEILFVGKANSHSFVTDILLN